MRVGQMTTPPKHTRSSKLIKASALLLIGASALVLTQAIETSEVEGNDSQIIIGEQSERAEDTWNYDKAGADWNFLNCNNTKQQQSPVDLLNPGMDWWKPKSGPQFVFLPSFKAKPSTSVLVENFTYTVYGDFGSFIAPEPSDYLATQIVKWNSKYIKFHYPSEHSYGGVTYDVEMQIYHEVRVQKQDYLDSNLCYFNRKTIWPMLFVSLVLAF